MKESNEKIVEGVKEYLITHDIYFIEKPNGQFIIDGANYYSTTTKWYDPRTGNKGFGLNTCLKYLREK